MKRLAVILTVSALGVIPAVVLVALTSSDPGVQLQVRIWWMAYGDRAISVAIGVVLGFVIDALLHARRKDVR